jgi:membrane-associated phospholipid phosphatase
MQFRSLQTQRLLRASWAICATATAAALLMTWAVGFRLELGTFFSILLVFLLLVGIHIVYTVLRPIPVFAAVSGGIAVTSWSLMMVGVTALAGLGLHAPLIDEALIRADASLGLNAAVFTDWVARYPGCASLLMGFYISSIPLVFATVLFLALTGRHERMWAFCLSITGAAMVCALVGSVIPAIGSFTELNIPLSTRQVLPGGAGTYYLAAFEAYRSGSLHVIDITRLDGVVIFPSFHVIMALATAYGYRGIRLIGAIAYAANAIVIVATVPMGGHYFIDLLAGAVVWGPFAMITRERSGLAPGAALIVPQIARAPSGL